MPDSQSGTGKDFDLFRGRVGEGRTENNNHRPRSGGCCVSQCQETTGMKQLFTDPYSGPSSPSTFSSSTDPTEREQAATVYKNYTHCGS